MAGRIWIHAASIGESTVALTLARHLGERDPNAHFLLTTGTVTSADWVARRLPPRTIHQVVPFDEYTCVARFFSGWRPRVGFLVESELWPNLLAIGSKRCPIVLLSARLSDRSFRRWNFFRPFAAKLLRNFSLILGQSEEDTVRFSQLSSAELGKPVVLQVGNLKLCAGRPPRNSEQEQMMKQRIGNRPVLFAASTHRGEERLICQLHSQLEQEHPRLLTIIALRHPARRRGVLTVIASHQLRATVRSRGPIEDSTQVHVVDTFGELPLFFAISDATWIGGSSRHGGHNPIEPAHFDAPIFFGPDMSSFRGISEQLVSLGAATQVTNFSELRPVASEALARRTARSTGAARALSTLGDDVMRRSIDAIAPYLD